MFLARELTKRQEKIKNFKEGFLPIFISILAVCGLIAPANLSTALMVFGTSVLLLLIGRVSVKQIAIVCLAGEIGRAWWRERVGPYGEIWEVAVSLKKNTR